MTLWTYEHITRNLLNHLNDDVARSSSPGMSDEAVADGRRLLQSILALGEEVLEIGALTDDYLSTYDGWASSRSGDERQTHANVLRSIRKESLKRAYDSAASDLAGSSGPYSREVVYPIVKQGLEELEKFPEEWRRTLRELRRIAKRLA